MLILLCWVDGFLFGVSLESVELVVCFDWNFVFVVYFNGDSVLCCVVFNCWCEFSLCEVMVVVQVVVVDDLVIVVVLVQQVEVWGVELENGQWVIVGSEVQVVVFVCQVGS